MTRSIAIAACFVLLQIASAGAQSTAMPRSDGAVNCAPTTTSSDTNSIATIGKSGEALGDKLARTDGVLCPPAGVDPDIRAPVPDAGTSRTPVIPPPGSPGGGTNVRPK